MTVDGRRYGRGTSSSTAGLPQNAHARVDMETGDVTSSGWAFIRMQTGGVAMETGDVTRVGVYLVLAMQKCLG